MWPGHIYIELSSLSLKTCHRSLSSTSSEDSPSAGSCGSSSHENWTLVQTAPCPPPSTHQGRGWSLADQQGTSRCCVYARRACREPVEHRNVSDHWQQAIGEDCSRNSPAQHYIHAFLLQLQCTHPLRGKIIHTQISCMMRSQKNKMTKKPKLQILTFRVNYCVIWRPNQHATAVFITVFCGAYKIPIQKVCITCVSK